MILYDPEGTHLSETEINSQVHASTYLNEDNLTVLNATQLFNKHLSDSEFLVSTLVTQKSWINLTRVTMTSNVISTMMDPVKADDKSFHHIMLLILLGVFTVISLSLSLAIIVFCRKKNTVFMLQKCEQESEVELDDLPTEIENSDSDSEDIRTSLRIKRSESYPGVAKSKCANGRKTESSSLMKETNKMHSSSLIPLLKKAENVKGATILVSDSRNNSINHMKKSSTFSTQQECLNLLGKSHALANCDYNFGSISNNHRSAYKKGNYITIVTEEGVCPETNNTSVRCDRLEGIIVDSMDLAEPADDKDKDALVQEDTFDFTDGKLEIL